MRKSKRILYISVGWLTGAVFLFTPLTPHAWEVLAPGLLIGEFDPAEKSPVPGDSIVVLRIDPEKYELKLLSTSEQGGKPRTARQWAEDFGLSAVINASMYQEDHKTSTGYMKNFGHINNGQINSKFGAFLVFHPRSPGIPPVQIIDRYHQGWKDIIQQYDTVIQNYRMISLKGDNVWDPSNEMYSAACVGMDQEGHVLFIHSRASFSVHDLNRILLGLPIHIKNAMYVEGGKEAALYVNMDGKARAWVGSYEIDVTEHTPSRGGPEIPNVIGIVKRK
ncbi:MAG: phosphodiester glycosidase family protein [Deltaproteobacteria bacterium]|nr:phosphodiester glycosidase family protein [Deltaproteobacteria bacterium]